MSKGVEYKSDYATIKRWVILRVEEQEQRLNKQNNNFKSKEKNRFNFEEREYPEEFFESLYDNDNIPSMPLEENESETDEMEFD